MLIRLSPTQEDALYILNERMLDDFTACMCIGRSRDKTLGALERHGLARYYPYGAGGHGSWRITAEGRKWLTQREALIKPMKGCAE